MAIKLTLTSEKILDKKFPTAPRGYDALEVDQFLDIILKDYRLVESSVLLLKKELDDLNSKIEELQKAKQILEIENAKYQQRFKGIKESDKVTTDNIQLLKRINALETFLYREGFDPKKIK